LRHLVLLAIFLAPAEGRRIAGQRVNSIYR
jgi:hypothetical protein